MRTHWSAAIGLAIFLTAIAVPARADAPIEMILTNEIATTHWSTKIMDQYAATIADRSGGRLQPKVFHAGTLYKDKEAVASLGSGAVHMVWPVSVQLESIAPQYGVINLPYAVTDHAMSRPEVSKAVAALLSRFVADKGIRVMGLMRTADLIFVFRDKAVTSPEALKGTKVRLTGGRILQALMKELGASPVSMAASEMGAALMQGAIDGAYTSAGGWEMIGANAAKVATLVPGLSLLTYSVLVDDKWLQSLPPDLRTVIEEVTAETIAQQWPRGIAADKETLAKLVSEGGSVVVVDPVQQERFRQIAAKASEDFIRKYPEVWKEYQAIVQQK